MFAADANGTYTAVLLGSGDREHPFDATVQNAFFMIKDRDAQRAGSAPPANTTVSVASPTPNTSPAAPLAKADLFDATNAVVDNSVPVAANGWFVDLRAGEKVVGSAVTIAGIDVLQHQPAERHRRRRRLQLEPRRRPRVPGRLRRRRGDRGPELASARCRSRNRSTIHAGGGYLPSPVPVVVEIDGKKYQAVISGTSVQTPPGLTLEKRTRTFWYKQID